MEEREDNTIYKVVMNHEEQLLDLAGGPGKSARVEGCRQDGAEAAMPGIHQGSLDRYAPA